MALGGVPTGNMNPMLAPKQAASRGGSGGSPSSPVRASTSGPSMLTVATFEASSVSTMVVASTSAVSPQSEVTPVASTTPRPTTPARPVSNSILPNDNPPPKRSSVPQSTRTASSQVSA